MNLIQETIEALREAGTYAIWVKANGRAYTWVAFSRIADIEYDAGFGAQEISQSLTIGLADGTWLERGEYDGSEWWEHRTAPAAPAVMSLSMPVSAVMEDALPFPEANDE